MPDVFLILTILFSVGLLYGAYIDLKTRRVPNFITLGLFLTAAIYRFPDYAPEALLFTLLIFLAWKSGFLGGADAKLWMAVAVLWNTQTGIIAAGLTMTITSLLVIAVTKLRHSYRPLSKKPGAWKVIPFFFIGLLVGFV